MDIVFSGVTDENFEAVEPSVTEALSSLTNITKSNIFLILKPNSRRRRLISAERTIEATFEASSLEDAE